MAPAFLFLLNAITSDSSTPFTTVGVLKEIRSIRWNDWKAIGRVSDGSKKGSALIVVDVRSRVRRRHLNRALKLSLPVIFALLFRLTPTGDR